MRIFKQGCQKWDHSYNNDKNWVNHILFLRKRGHIVYRAALKKGAIRHAYPYFAVYRLLVRLTDHTFVAVDSDIDWLQSLKQFFINVSYHILVASLTLMALKTEPSELDWLQVYDMTH